MSGAPGRRAIDNPAPDHRSGRLPARAPSVLTLTLALCLLAGLTGGGRAERPRQDDHELRDALVQQSVVAANSRRPETFAQLATDDARPDLNWVTSKTSQWSGGVLDPPGSANDVNAKLIVFYAWHTCESDGDHVHKLVKTPDGWRIGKEIPETDPGPLRVVDHTLDVTFAPDQNGATITDVAKIERIPHPTSDVPLLRISSDFKIEEMRLGGPRGGIVTFRQVGGVIALTPPRAGAFTLYLRYAGHVKHEGSDYILPTEATLDSYWYPHTARLPARSTVTAHVPAGWSALGQGEAVANAAHDAFTFRNSLPVSFFTLDAAPWSITRRTYHGKALSVYLLRANAPYAERCLVQLEQALDFYETRFAPFPYTRYGIVETYGGFQGALEAYSFATFQAGTAPMLIAHELSHTWWGGIVPCTYTRSMWNESFAEYSDSLFQREMTKRPHGMVGGLKHTARVEAALAHSYDAGTMADAHDTSDPSQSAIGYGKGAFVMRVLEEEIGKPAMMRCLSAFAAVRRSQAPTEWSDFERVVDRVTGKDYRWFFAEWMERPGLPSVWLGDLAVSPPDTRGVRTISGEIKQAGDPYRIDTSVRLDLKNGKSINQPIAIDGPSTKLTLTADASPDLLTLDPDSVIPLGPPPAAGPNDDLTVHRFDENAGPNPPAPFPTRLVNSARERGERTIACAAPPNPPAPSPTRLVNSAREGGERTVARAAHRAFCPVDETPALSRDGACVGSPPSLGSGSDRPGKGAGGLGSVAQYVNAGDRERFRELEASGVTNELDWIGAASATSANDPANTALWRAVEVAAPAGGQRLLVVTRYHPCESRGDHVYPIVSDGGRDRIGAEIVERDPGAFRIVAHKANVTLKPETGSLWARDVVSLRRVPNASNALPAENELVRLEDGLAVSSVARDAKPVPFVQAGGVIVVAVGDAAPDSVTLVLTYHGKAMQSDEDFITPKEAALSGYWLPETARLPATANVSIAVPIGWSAYTQGALTSRRATADGVTYTYDNEVPVSVESLAAGPYKTIERAAGNGHAFGVTVAYLRAALEPTAKKALDLATSAISFFSERFAPFPYPRYTVVISDKYTLALEGYSMTTVGKASALDSLVHEISHTWWGGVVPNTYLSDMWNESFAEYSDGLFGRLTNRASSMHDTEVTGAVMLGMLNSRLGRPLRTACDALDPLDSMTGYIKGSVVLEALEKMVGTEAILKGVREIVSSHKSGEADTWDEVEASLVSGVGPDAKGLLDYWLDQRGVPTLQIENVSTVTPAGGSIVTVKVSALGGSAPWEPVTVALKLANGDVKREIAELKGGPGEARFSLDSGQQPVTATIDLPENRLRSRPTPQAPPLAQMLSSSAPVLIVYGSDAPDVERAAMRRAAASAAKLFPAAKVTVISDAKAAEQGPGTVDMLLIGTPSTNRMLTALAGLIPLSFDSGPSLSIGGKRYTDPDTWGLGIGAMPAAGGGARIMVFAGLSPTAYDQITGVNQLPGNATAYIAHGNGDMLERNQPTDPPQTTYRFPSTR